MPLPTNAPSSSKSALRDPFDPASLPRILAEALTSPDSKLGKKLSSSQRLILKELYLPGSLATRYKPRSRVQILANGRTALLSKVRKLGVTRVDLRLGLERIRYLSFSDGVERWIGSATSSVKAPPPQPISFDLRTRAHAKKAFQLLCDEWGIPKLGYDTGTLTPSFNKQFGFFIKVQSGKSHHSFLVALPNGEKLKPISDTTLVTNTSISSPNRNLSNLLWLQAPVDFNVAMAPRDVTDVGCQRVALFSQRGPGCLSKYVYLPPSVKDKRVTPVVDIDALMVGERKVHLSTISRPDPLATVIVTGTIDKPEVRVTHPPSIAPSPFTRAKPVAAYLRGKSDLLPDPVTLEIRRRELPGGLVHQRIFLGNQMTAPTWYPLTKLTVHCLTSPSGKRYLGQYPVGVSPLTSPPMRAFSLHPEEARWIPERPEVLWTLPDALIAKARKLLSDVLSKDVPTSRDGWLDLNLLTQAHPIVAYNLFIAGDTSDLSSDAEALDRVKSLPGWSAFKSSLLALLVPLQAKSTPFISALLSQALGGNEQEAPLAKCPDRGLPLPNPAESKLLLARMCVTAEKELAETLRLLRGSPVKLVRDLVESAERERLVPRIG